MSLPPPRSRNGTVRLQVGSPLDAGAGAVLRAQVLDAVMEADQVVIDLTATPYASASGLRALLEAALAARQGGVTLSVSNPSPRLLRSLHVSGLDGVIGTVPASSPDADTLGDGAGPG